MVSSSGRGRETGRCSWQLQVHDRSHLDAPEARQRNPRSELDRFVQIPRFDEDESAELLLRLGKGTVGGEQLAVSHPQGGCRLDALERVCDDEVTTLLEFLVIREGLGREALGFALGERIQRLLLAADDAQVSHDVLLVRAAAVDTQSSLGFEKIDTFRRAHVESVLARATNGRRPRAAQSRPRRPPIWEGRMSRVRVLVGTRKGAFVLESDGTRGRWSVNGPLFGGWEMYHVKGSPADPNRLYASQGTGWFGQLIQRSDDGGKSWETVGNQFQYEGATGTHLWYDGTPHPWEFARVWHIEPSLTDPDTVYAGVEDAALFRSRDGGQTWQELPGLRTHRTAASWAPGAGGMCLHTIILHPSDPGRLFTAISSAGSFRSDDGGTTWQPINRGLTSEGIPDPHAEVGHCVHRIAMHRSRPDVLFMQKHWDVMRSDDAGESWQEVSGNLPSDFGFPIDVHAHEPGTIYVVPIKSDSEHYPPDGKLRVYRSRTGGHEWEALTSGLPQRDCYVNVLRDAMSSDALDPCGIYFGTTGGQAYASPDAGDSWAPTVPGLPAR